MYKQILTALEFASAFHKGQTRKYSGEAYIIHPVCVYSILLHAGVTDEDILQGAILHDTVEDTECTLEDIVHSFGGEVAGLVRDSSSFCKLNPSEEFGNRADRKERDQEFYKNGTYGSFMIKFADAIHNGRSILREDLSFARVWFPEKIALMGALEPRLLEETYGNRIPCKTLIFEWKHLVSQYKILNQIKEV